MNGTAMNGTSMQQRPAEGRDADASVMERVIAQGDLARLTPQDRVAYYMATCRSVGLNPLTQPLQYIALNGKLTLYCAKNATDQLRALRGVSVRAIHRDTADGVHIVTCRVSTPDGREDEDIGAVVIAGLKGEALANALMKATTKAKRRATLSICGLSFLDESELDTVPEARRVVVDQDGVIVSEPRPTAPTPARPAPAPPASEPRLYQDALAADFAKQLSAIVNAKGSMADLKKVSVKIARSPLDREHREKLRAVYEMAIGAVTAPANAPSPEAA